MDEAVLKQLIKNYLSILQSCYIFTWQGGEPTLMGHDFFLRVIELQKKYSREGSIIANGVQTNGTLLSDNLCRLFRKYNFLVGCSLDGPPNIHDKYRLTPGGEPTHSKVMDGIRKMHDHGVEFNIMTLVSQANVHKAQEVYRYFRNNGFLYHQYIPCVEFDERGDLQPFAITGEEWGHFLCQIFDEWFPNDINTVSIRHFDTILTKLVNNEITTCTNDNNCRQYCVIEHNGDVYPCDFFVKKEYLLGNITETPLEELVQSYAFHNFSAMKTDWSDACRNCDFLDLCAGDCTKHRINTGDLEQSQSFLCKGWKQFFNYSYEPLNKLAKTIHKHR